MNVRYRNRSRFLPVIIREAKEEDINDIISIEMESFTAPWTRESHCEEMSNPLSVLRVAEYNDNLVGYICASIFHDEGHILNLASHPLYRRMGVAKALVKDIISYIRDHGGKKIFLEVRTSNMIAVQLYNGLGFEITARRKDYYRTPREDAVVMMLECE